MEDAEKVRALYAGLAEVGQKIVQEATHSPGGILNLKRFQAKYGRYAGFWRQWQSLRQRAARPRRLRLFFPHHNVLPRDLREILLTFVPKPPPLTVEASDELPARIRMPHVDRGPYEPRVRDEEEVELRVRQTARAALHDVKAVLRLIDAGEVRVGDKTQRPSQAAMKAIAGVLAEGDFYTEADQRRNTEDPASDLQIQAFAWPMLLQAAGLAKAAGTRLQLTPAGRKATARPAHEVIGQVWEQVAENHAAGRVQPDQRHQGAEVQGPRPDGRRSTAATRSWRCSKSVPRRNGSPSASCFGCSRPRPTISPSHTTPGSSTSASSSTGSFGYDGGYSGRCSQGRFVLAFLFEYAATLGLLDVAYLPPAGVRSDYPPPLGRRRAFLPEPLRRPDVRTDQRAGRVVPGPGGAVRAGGDPARASLSGAPQP